MGAVPSSVPKAVPTAVAPSSGNSVLVNSKAQRGPYKPMSGSSHVPAVPRSDQPDPLMATQPGYGGTGTAGRPLNNGSGAPSVPAQTTALFRRGPIDQHYLSEAEASNPYAVNRPAAPGLFTWVKTYVNGIFLGRQNVDTAGWQTRQAQQRTSYMRITPPAHGGGYAPETYVPRQLPQSDATYKYNPITGNDQPGVHILNRTTYGAGQTAGGVGGNQYTPAPGPPDTAAVQPQGGGMPTWG